MAQELETDVTPQSVLSPIKHLNKSEGLQPLGIEHEDQDASNGMHVPIPLAEGGVSVAHRALSESNDEHFVDLDIGSSGSGWENSTTQDIFAQEMARVAASNQFESNSICRLPGLVARPLPATIRMQIQQNNEKGPLNDEDAKSSSQMLHTLVVSPNNAKSKIASRKSESGSRNGSPSHLKAASPSQFTSSAGSMANCSTSTAKRVVLTASQQRQYKIEKIQAQSSPNKIHENTSQNVASVTDSEPNDADASNGLASIAADFINSQPQYDALHPLMRPASRMSEEEAKQIAARLSEATVALNSSVEHSSEAGEIPNSSIEKHARMDGDDSQHLLPSNPLFVSDGVSNPRDGRAIITDLPSDEITDIASWTHRTEGKSEDIQQYTTSDLSSLTQTNQRNKTDSLGQSLSIIPKNCNQDSQKKALEILGTPPPRSPSVVDTLRTVSNTEDVQSDKAEQSVQQPNNDLPEEETTEPVQVSVLTPQVLRVTEAPEESGHNFQATNSGASPKNTEEVTDEPLIAKDMHGQAISNSTLSQHSGCGSDLKHIVYPQVPQQYYSQQGAQKDVKAAVGVISLGSKELNERPALQVSVGAQQLGGRAATGKTRIQETLENQSAERLMTKAAPGERLLAHMRPPQPSDQPTPNDLAADGSKASTPLHEELVGHGKLVKGRPSSAKSMNPLRSIEQAQQTSKSVKVDATLPSGVHVVGPSILEFSWESQEVNRSASPISLGAWQSADAHVQEDSITPQGEGMKIVGRDLRHHEESEDRTLLSKAPDIVNTGQAKRSPHPGLALAKKAVQSRPYSSFALQNSDDVDWGELENVVSENQRLMSSTKKRVGLQGTGEDDSSFLNELYGTSGSEINRRAEIRNPYLSSEIPSQLRPGRVKATGRMMNETSKTRIRRPQSAVPSSRSSLPHSAVPGKTIYTQFSPGKVRHNDLAAIGSGEQSMGLLSRQRPGSAMGRMQKIHGITQNSHEVGDHQQVDSNFAPSPIDRSLNSGSRQAEDSGATGGVFTRDEPGMQSTGSLYEKVPSRYMNSVSASTSNGCVTSFGADVRQDTSSSSIKASDQNGSNMTVSISKGNHSQSPEQQAEHSSSYSETASTLFSTTVTNAGSSSMFRLHTPPADKSAGYSQILDSLQGLAIGASSSFDKRHTNTQDMKVVGGQGLKSLSFFSTKEGDKGKMTAGDGKPTFSRLGTQSSTTGGTKQGSTSLETVQNTVESDDGGTDIPEAMKANGQVSLEHGTEATDPEVSLEKKDGSQIDVKSQTKMTNYAKDFISVKGNRHIQPVSATVHVHRIDSGPAPIIEREGPKAISNLGGDPTSRAPVKVISSIGSDIVNHSERRWEGKAPSKQPLKSNRADLTSYLSKMETSNAQLNPKHLLMDNSISLNAWNDPDSHNSSNSVFQKRPKSALALSRSTSGNASRYHRASSGSSKARQVQQNPERTLVPAQNSILERPKSAPSLSAERAKSAYGNLAESPDNITSLTTPPHASKLRPRPSLGMSKTSPSKTTSKDHTAAPKKYSVTKSLSESIARRKSLLMKQQQRLGETCISVSAIKNPSN